MNPQERINLIDKKIDSYLEYLSKKEIESISNYQMDDKEVKIKTSYVSDTEILISIEKLISIKNSLINKKL